MNITSQSSISYNSRSSPINSTLLDYDYFGDHQDYLAEDPTVRTVATFTLLIYTVAVIVGLPANIYVLIRMRRLARTDHEKYLNGTGIALRSMAAADLCSLLLILGQNLMQMTLVPGEDTIFLSVVCKLTIFLTHTVTAISIWSWLLLSTLRYLAVRHPLFHLRLWQMPYKALAFIATMSFALNVWLLVAVTSSPYGCTQYPLFHSLTFNRMFHIAESVWSFCLPSAMIILMDASVMFKSTNISPYFGRFYTHKRCQMKMSDASLIIASGARLSKTSRQRHSHSLWRWLAIALVCVMLNTPENMYRMVMLFGMPDFTEQALHYAARMLAQAFYFSQFAFNAVYLAVFVFDKSTRAKVNQQESSPRSFADSYIASSLKKFKGGQRYWSIRSEGDPTTIVPKISTTYSVISGGYRHKLHFMQGRCASIEYA